MKTFKIDIVYLHMFKRYTDSAYAHENNSMAAHRSAILSIPKDAELIKIIIKECKNDKSN